MLWFQKLQYISSSVCKAPNNQNQGTESNTTLIEVALFNLSHLLFTIQNDINKA